MKFISTFFDIPDLENARIDTKIESVLCLQPEITKVIPVHVYDLEFQGQPSKSRDSFWFIEIPTSRMLKSTPRSIL